MTSKKKNGVVFTPYDLGNFIAEGIISRLKIIDQVRVIEPSVGDGQLLRALLDLLIKEGIKSISVTAFDINDEYIKKCELLFNSSYPNIEFNFKKQDFLEYALTEADKYFDVMIANPPYVRTQNLDKKIMVLANEKLGMGGKVDLYQLFIKVSEKVMNDNGIIGIVVSNKFLSNKTGKDLRTYLSEFHKPDEIIDFGDTKLFKAAVLPCVMFFNGNIDKSLTTKYTSIYSSQDAKETGTYDIFTALKTSLDFGFIGEQQFTIKRGVLKVIDNYDWILSNDDSDSFLELVDKNTSSRFKDVSKIRVGIKTTADNVFISNSWSQLGNKKPELLYPLITHHIAGQIKPTGKPVYEVLYPYDFSYDARKVVDIDSFPNTKEYLEKNYDQLNSRKYVVESNKKWFEIWVPHTPKAWKKEKIVFRDISEHPNFWYDEGFAIVNGDCYWIDLNDGLEEDLIWLMLGVANTKFITEYYDLKFNNKLYSNRRRYMSQYVEQFPIPDINKKESKEIIRLSKEVYISNIDASDKLIIIDTLVKEVFSQKN